MKITAIMGGGDWADASVDHLVLPGDWDIVEKNREYQDAGGYRGTRMFFVEWLIGQGARRALDEVEEFWEY